jgi:hypothetical protein
MKTMTASQLQKIREALSNALSGEVVELKIIQLSDSGFHIEVILREHPEEENIGFVLPKRCMRRAPSGENRMRSSAVVGNSVTLFPLTVGNEKIPC